MVLVEQLLLVQVKLLLIVGGRLAEQQRLLKSMVKHRWAFYYSPGRTDQEKLV